MKYLVILSMGIMPEIMWTIILGGTIACILQILQSKGVIR